MLLSILFIQKQELFFIQKNSDSECPILRIFMMLPGGGDIKVKLMFFLNVLKS